MSWASTTLKKKPNDNSDYYENEEYIKVINIICMFLGKVIPFMW